MGEASLREMEEVILVRREQIELILKRIDSMIESVSAPEIKPIAQESNLLH